MTRRLNNSSIVAIWFLWQPIRLTGLPKNWRFVKRLPRNHLCKSIVRLYLQWDNRECIFSNNVINLLVLEQSTQKAIVEATTMNFVAKYQLCTPYSFRLDDVWVWCAIAINRIQNDMCVEGLDDTHFWSCFARFIMRKHFVSVFPITMTV